MVDRSSLHIVRMREPHLPEVFALVDHENWGWEFAEIQEIYRFDPGSSVVALDGRDIVGIVTCVDFGTVAFIVHVIVRKGWRGKGVGARMVEAVLAELDSRGVGTVELQSNPESVEFYSRYSFRRLEDIAYLVREPPHEPASRTAEGSGFSWSSPGNTAAVAEAMSLAMGSDKGGLSKALARSQPHFALARLEEGRPTALLLSRVASELNAAGPWVMERPDRTEAERMMRVFLSGVPAKRIDVMASSSNEVAMAAFRACGFTLAKAGISRLSRSSGAVSLYPRTVLSVGHLGLI